MADKQLVWIDVETNGLKASEKSLLEIAAYVTDLDLNILDEVGFQREIYYTAEEITELRLDTNEYVTEMHTKTGLWDRLLTGSPLATVETDLLAYIQKYVPEANTARLAGNSVSLDKDFIETYLPSVGEHLHYRIMDVSSIAGLGQWWYGEQYTKNGSHNAREDILESIAELRYLKENIFK